MGSAAESSSPERQRSLLRVWLSGLAHDVLPPAEAQSALNELLDTLVEEVGAALWERDIAACC